MKKYIAALVSVFLLLALASCVKDAGNKEDPSAAIPEDETRKVTVCLDWTPNTNHTGLFVAQARGYYADAGLDVTLVQPPENGAVQACAAGQAEFAVDFQDGLAAAFTSEVAEKITVVAAIEQHNTSGVMSLAGQGMNRPAGLAGKTYLSWDSPIELAMMKHVVEADGGDWSKVTVIPNVVTDEAADVTAYPDHAIWVYAGWSLVNADLKGVDTDFFYFRDIDPVFDYYTPVIVANADLIRNEPDVVRAFLFATSKGYTDAANEPDAAAKILVESDDTGSLIGSEELVTASQQILSATYIDDAEKWGVIDADRWNAFYKWLADNGLTETAIPENFGFTNEFLP